MKQIAPPLAAVVEPRADTFFLKAIRGGTAARAPREMTNSFRHVHNNVKLTTSRVYTSIVGYCHSNIIIGVL